MLSHHIYFCEFSQQYEYIKTTKKQKLLTGVYGTMPKNNRKPSMASTLEKRRETKSIIRPM
jgi:hypothetical protein